MGKKFYGSFLNKIKFFAYFHVQMVFYRICVLLDSTDFKVFILRKIKGNRVILRVFYINLVNFTSPQ